MSDIDVRIKELEPMRVASFKVVSANPEYETWEKLNAWASTKGYLGNIEEHPIFGFNNPGPSPERKDYGYESWIRVPLDTESDGAFEIKDFPGGLYAVTTHKGLPNPDVWMSLWKWVQSSSHLWRKTHELEKPHNPLASHDKIIFDLFLPIMK
ncbi:GyrI-like domain-containing protein [Candidatus Riflebacteria bacterium]